MVVKNLRSSARLSSKPLFTTAVAGVILAIGALAGCGTAAPVAGTGSHSPAKATLTLKLTDKAAHTTTHWSLRCGPAGGTAPDAAVLCKTLFGAKHAFGPMPRIMCPMIMVSAKQIVLDGTWYGKKVHRVIIDGGCDLNIFNSLNKTIG